MTAFPHLTHFCHPYFRDIHLMPAARRSFCYCTNIQLFGGKLHFCKTCDKVNKRNIPCQPVFHKLQITNLRSELFDYNKIRVNSHWKQASFQENYNYALR